MNDRLEPILAALTVLLLAVLFALMLGRLA